MSNSIVIARNALMVTDLGYGTAPDCLSLFKPGDVVKIRNMEILKGFPRQAIVAAVVPPHFPPSHALADLLDEPRPLASTKPTHHVSYILVNEGDRKPYLAKEKYLLRTELPPVELGRVRREGPNQRSAA
jgi:hypothetical protein